MDPHNLNDLVEAVATWQQATRELRGHLAEVYFAEGYDLKHDQVIGEAASCAV